MSRVATPAAARSTGVKVTYLEIYNEELADLLDEEESGASSASRQRLQIVEDRGKRGRGVFCKGLREIPVEAGDDVLRILHRAQERRRVGETRMNKQSSRSHCLFTILVETVEQDADGNMLEHQGRLHLCDLAGSECAKTANGVDGSSLGLERERKNINQSLLTLGRVITTLQEAAANPGTKVRIPYRDSKLTRILQDALGGRSKTCVIATVSPSILAVDESLSTLNYAQRAAGARTVAEQGYYICRRGGGHGGRGVGGGRAVRASHTDGRMQNCAFEQASKTSP